MEFLITQDTLDRLNRYRAREGVTQELCLLRIVNALRDLVPEHARRTIRVVAVPSGRWGRHEGDQLIEINHIEMETTLRECAGSLGVSFEDALLRGMGRDHDMRIEE